MTTMLPPALNLSNLAARIDMTSFYERYVTISGKPTNSRKDGKEWACSCPVCGGTDRASFWESGRFTCVRGCHAHCSSPYFFLRDIKGYDHQQALEELGIDAEEIDFSGQQSSGNSLPLFLTKDEAPNKKWQESASAFVHAAEKCLWSSKGESARKYLQSRGLTEATIKSAHLGLCPDWYKAPLEDWGLSPAQLNKEDDPQIKIPKGITIPWFIDGAIWKIQIRRPEPGPDGKKYKEVTGSSDALYNLDSFQPGQPVLLVESELDALSAMQEAGELTACLATGSTTKARTSRWIGKLKLASQVLVAFDDDEAGERGANEWIRALPNASHWTPWSHDVNDMLTSGEDIHDWIEIGLALGQTELPEIPEQGEEQTDRMVVEAQPAPPALQSSSWPWWENHLHTREERIAAFQSRPCAGCGGIDWMIDLDGLLICPCVQRKREENARLVPEPMPVLREKSGSSRDFWQTSKT